MIMFPESEWSDSAFVDAIIKQVIDTSSVPMKTKYIYKETYKGIHWIDSFLPQGGYLYGAVLDGKSLTRGQIAIWDAAPSYGASGNNSQFWSRDSTDITSQERINEVIENIKNHSGSTYTAYDRIGQVYVSDMEKPYTKSDYSYHDIQNYSPSYFSYCFGSVIYTLDDERQSDFYKIVEVKKVNNLDDVAYYYRNIFWGGYSPANKSVIFYRMKKCNSAGVIDASWKSFDKNYTVEKGGDYEEDDVIIQGVNITVFDHVD